VAYSAYDPYEARRVRRQASLVDNEICRRNTSPRQAARVPRIGGHELQGRSSALVLVTYFLLVGYCVLSVNTSRVWMIHRLFFAVTTVIMLLAVCATFVTNRRAAHSLGAVPGRCVLGLTVFIIPVLFQEIRYPLWIVGDCAVLLAPVLFFLAGGMSESIFSERSLRRLVYVLFVLSLAAAAFPDPNDSMRFNPPYSLVMASLWVWFLIPRNRTEYVFSAVALPVVLVLCWYSMVRIEPIIFVLIGSIVVAARGFRHMKTVVFAISMIAILSVGPIVAPNVVDRILASHPRFAVLFDNQGGAGEGPIEARADEAVDVWSEFTDSRNPLKYLLGHGYGATYNARRSLDVYNYRRELERVTAEGQRHVIHFGPLRILLRYGLLGAAAVLLLMRSILRDLYRVVSGKWRLQEYALRTILALSLLGYFVRFFFQPVSNRLMFSFICGGYLFLLLVESRGRKVERARKRSHSMRRSTRRNVSLV